MLPRCPLRRLSLLLSLPAPASTPSPTPSSQRSLSGKIEALAFSTLLHDPAVPRARRLHFDACRAPGARAWLTATPASPDTHIPSPLFRTSMQRRLRMPIWDADSACGLCGETLDRWGNHALCCGGGGDRVRRHNAVRNIVCSAVAEYTSVSPELEKPGLLLPPGPRDPGGTFSDPDGSPSLSPPGGGRRPAVRLRIVFRSSINFSPRKCLEC